MSTALSTGSGGGWTPLVKQSPEVVDTSKVSFGAFDDCLRNVQAEAGHPSQPKTCTMVPVERCPLEIERQQPLLEFPAQSVLALIRWPDLASNFQLWFEFPATHFAAAQLPLEDTPGGPPFAPTLVRQRPSWNLVNDQESCASVAMP